MCSGWCNNWVNVLCQYNDQYLTKELDTKILFEWLILAALLNTCTVHYSPFMNPTILLLCYQQYITDSNSESHKSNTHSQIILRYILRCLDRSKAFSQVWCVCFETCCIRSVTGLFQFHPTQAWTATPFTINSQLLCICGRSLLHKQHDDVACSGNKGPCYLTLRRFLSAAYVQNLTYKQFDEIQERWGRRPVCSVCESN